MDTKNYSTILNEMKQSAIAGGSGLTDFNSGSNTMNIFEAVARPMEQAYIDTRNGYTNNLRAIPYSVFDFKQIDDAVGAVKNHVDLRFWCTFLASPRIELGRNPIDVKCLLDLLYMGQAHPLKTQSQPCVDLGSADMVAPITCFSLGTRHKGKVEKRVEINKLVDGGILFRGFVVDGILAKNVAIDEVFKFPAERSA